MPSASTYKGVCVVNICVLFRPGLENVVRSSERFFAFTLAKVGFLILSSAVAGCATQGPIRDLPTVLESGNIRLSCGFMCSVADGDERIRYRYYYDNYRWLELAAIVARVGFDIDRNYFYLGSAAEGMGYRHAAQTYYRLALGSSSRCADFINVCDGLDVPSLVLARTKEISRQTLTEEKEELERAVQQPVYELKGKYRSIGQDTSKTRKQTQEQKTDRADMRHDDKDATQTDERVQQKGENEVEKWLRKQGQIDE